MNIQEHLILAKLRFAVGYLGESVLPPWWTSGVSLPNANPFLTPVFPRSLNVVRYEALCLAARRLHDQHVGIGRVFHLFRLPDELEQVLHDVVRGPRETELRLPTNQEEAITVLEIMAASSPARAEGPIWIGRPEDVRARRTWVEAAGLYLNAFITGHQVHPYLADQ